MDINFKLQIPTEFSKALSRLSDTLEKLACIEANEEATEAQQPVQQPVATQPVQPIAQAVPQQSIPQPIAQTASQQPIPQPVASQVAQPTQVQQPSPAPIPQTVATTPLTYSLDDIAKAAMTLMDAGRQSDLQQLLQKYGVESLPQLPESHYGAFATDLRGLGAQI